MKTTILVLTGLLTIPVWCRGQDGSNSNPVPGRNQVQTRAQGQTRQPENPDPGSSVIAAENPRNGAADAQGNEGIRLNFRGVPLEMVLNHLSEAAGFIIVMETQVEGDVDVWSNQPLSQEEAVQLLNTILNKNGYAAIRNGRILTIVDRDTAIKRDIPVETGSDPQEIPRSDQLVTQVIPIRYARANQMVENLQPLVPSYATLSANESGNALVLTDTQANVRRIVQIVRALDTSISSISTIQVFLLRYADATQLAESVRALFEQPAGQGGDDDRRRRFFRGRDDDDDNRGAGESEARNAASRVVAVADERTNSLVVSAPEEFMPTIEDLVAEIDVNVADITEVRVFSLKNADPVELAAIFKNLFPDQTSQEENPPRGFRFGRGPFRGPANVQEQTSDRIRKQTQVIAVPDPRTSSLIVSAPSELMPQIEQMVAQLDAGNDKKQKVYVYSLENADVYQVEEVLRQMFERSNTGLNRSSANRNQNNTAVDNRRNQNQNIGNNGSGFGVGTGGGIGSGGGGGGR